MDLHPLCTYFPEFNDSMSEIDAIRSDRRAVVMLRRSHEDYWDFSVFDLDSQEQFTSRRPISGRGIWLILEVFSKGLSWSLRSPIPTGVQHESEAKT
jgi:hypothetical protein